MQTPAEFDPAQDLPPDGAVVAVLRGERVRYEAREGRWVVLTGPHAGAIARPFSPEGIAVAQIWWRRVQLNRRMDNYSDE